MKNLAQRLFVAGTPLLLLTGDAAAETCGGRFAPCKVPEPSTPALFIGALGVIALVAKFRKK